MFGNPIGLRIGLRVDKRLPDGTFVPRGQYQRQGVPCVECRALRHPNVRFMDDYGKPIVYDDIRNVMFIPTSRKNKKY
jgi:hypothetical protein